jgi:hypothetical protein
VNHLHLKHYNQATYRKCDFAGQSTLASDKSSFNLVARGTMASRTVIKVGDYFEIPLKDGRLAYCRLLHRGELGFLVQVLDLFRTTSPASTEELRNAPPLFPPVFVGLLATVRSGRWKKIGNVPVTYFAHPKFRQTMGTKPGTYHDWTIWDGLKTIKIGRLPVEHRSLELKCVWGDEGLEERILQGYYRGRHML